MSNDDRQVPCPVKRRAMKTMSKLHGSFVLKKIQKEDNILDVRRPHRLMVRTQGSQPCNRGSTPRGVTPQKDKGTDLYCVFVLSVTHSTGYSLFMIKLERI